MQTSFVPHRAFTPRRPIQRRPDPIGATVLDLIVLVLGTGGILLMAAYAALCDRI